MIYLRIIFLALAYIIGIVLAILFRVDIPAPLLFSISAIGIAGSIIFYIREYNWQSQSPIIIAMAIALISLPVGYWRTSRKTAAPKPDSLQYILKKCAAHTPVKMRGIICHEPQLRSNTQCDIIVCITAIKLKNEEKWRNITSGRIMVRTFYSRRSPPETAAKFNRLSHPDAYGYKIEIDTAVPRPELSLNPGDFNLAEYLMQNNLLMKLKCYAGRIKIVEESKGDFITELALRIKQSFIISYKQSIRNPASRLIAAATLGTRNALNSITYKNMEIPASFRRAGVGHVLAVSGLHVSIVSLLLYAMFRMISLRPRVFVPVQIIILILFAILTGARPSSVRAVIMNSIILLAIAYFRCNIRNATYIGLSLASLIILLINPYVLFSPAFLLSFGAVLSLVLLSAPIIRSIKLLKGFSLFFAALWLIILIAISYSGAYFFLDIKNWAGLIGLLWLGIVTGTVLNNRYPRFWLIGTDNIHPAFVLLVGAQLAIQTGMMIPLSGWFFSRFPVAGILVNLIAIPAIGVLVQLGMITGFLGMIPVIGQYLALPFGVTDTVIGNLFFALAHAGATWFPYPVLPKPSVKWMISYYLITAAVVLIESQRIKIQTLFYRIWPYLKNKSGPLPVLITYSIPAILIITPVINLIPRQQVCEKILCLADRKFPLVAIIPRDRKAVLINCGSKYHGSRTVLNAIRTSGAVSIKTAILCSTDPAAGLDAISNLNKIIPVYNIMLSTIGTNRADYINAIADRYLADMDKKGRIWAVNYGNSYSNLLTSLPRRTSLSEIKTGIAAKWHNGYINILPLPEKLPDRYVSSSKTRIAAIKQHDFRWLIITDTTPAVLRQSLCRNSEPYDVMLIADLTARKSFGTLLKTALQLAKPKVIIIAGNHPLKNFKLPAVNKVNTVSPTIFMTATDGAITSVITSDGYLKLNSFISGKKVILKNNL